MLRLLRTFVSALLVCAAVSLHADSIAITGQIYSVTVNNPPSNASLLNVGLDPFSAVLTFNLPDPASGTPFPGGNTYALPGATLQFSDASAPPSGASESNFDSITMTLFQSAGYDQFSVVARLPPDGNCSLGNELLLTFIGPSGSLSGNTSTNIPHAAFTSQNGGIPPVELLEDSGATDIQGSVSTYTYTPSSPVPEPASFVLLGSGVLAWRRLFGSGSDRKSRGGRACN